MILPIIRKKEIRNYFHSHGYDFLDNSTLVRIYCKKTQGFIYLPSREWYSRPYIFFMLYTSRKMLLMPFKVEWYRLLFTIQLNREIKKSETLKSK